MAFDPKQGNWAANPNQPYIVGNKDIKLYGSPPAGYSYGGGGAYFGGGSGTNSLNQKGAAAATKKSSSKKTSTKKKTSAKSAGPDPFAFDDPWAAFDPVAMAAREFDPQYTLLSQMADQAKANYTKAGSDIGGAWDLLSKEIGGREGNIRGAYTGMGKNIDTRYGGVTGNTNAEYEAAKAAIIENAKRTGTEGSIAGLLAKLAESQMSLNATTRSYGANAGNFNAQMGQNALEANKESADEAKWGGINARADFSSRLQSALSDISNKRLETQAAQGAAVNKYGMDINDRRVSAKNAWEELQNQRASQAMELQKMQDSAAASAAKLGAPKDIDISKLSPTEYLGYLAKIQYPNVGTDTQQRAVQAIQDTFNLGYKGKIKFANAQDFVQAVLSRNPNASKAGGDARQLAQMAQDYYRKIAGGIDKPYG